MARSLNTIIAQMDAQQASETVLSGINSPSQTAIYTAWKFISAFCIWFHENLWDLFRTELETTIAAAPIGTEGWVAEQALKFQYDSTTPQVLQLINWVPTYTTIDSTKQLISQCSVTTLNNKNVSIKVAKSTPPQALTTTELSSFQGYLGKIMFAGVSYQALSRSPDYVMINADITYDAQYTSTITASTVSAITTYMQTIPFDGKFVLFNLYDAIQSVSGFRDCVINDVAIRANTVPFSATTYLVQNNTTIMSKIPLYAGYCVQEVQTGYTFANQLTFIPG